MTESSSSINQRIMTQITEKKRVWFFLDYDGTLDEFTISPDIYIPKEKIMDQIRALSRIENVQVAIVSGRRLEQIQSLLPIPKLILAGTYGVEMLLSSGERVNRVEYHSIRTVIDQIKPIWEDLLKDREGFFLEDKGYSLAIHANFARQDEASDVLTQARRTIKDDYAVEPFRVTTGVRFLEIGPVLGNKGETVRYLLERFGQKSDLLVYIGDDDRDREAMKVIKQYQGITINVGQWKEIDTDLELSTPEEVLAWIRNIVKVLENSKV
jgi:trehalose 6-phosphate phosphatase